MHLGQLLVFIWEFVNKHRGALVKYLDFWCNWFLFWRNRPLETGSTSYEMFIEWVPINFQGIFVGQELNTEQNL